MKAEFYNKGDKLFIKIYVDAQTIIEREPTAEHKKRFKVELAAFEESKKHKKAVEKKATAKKTKAKKG